MKAWLKLGLLCLFASACAQTGLPPNVPLALVTPTTATDAGWWYVRFQMHWPANKDPDLSLDALVAREICAQLLATEGSNISLWRFHRRAMRDTAGHQFSFIFRASPQVAARVNAAIADNALLRSLLGQHVIDQVLYDNPNVNDKGDIAATSDKQWSPALAKSWPYYIMGVSRLWLELVQSNHTESASSAASLDALLAHYRQVNANVSAIWTEEGAHAFLHHLNAVFGYQPISIQERRALTF